MVSRIAQCSDCKHFIVDPWKTICKAFPEGIPREIILNEIIHDKPLPDQGNEIVYEET